METQWQNLAPSVTPNEADQVVELWLRQRMNGTEHEPVDTSALTVRDLAQALGAREEEIIGILNKIRDKHYAPRVRTAMPLDRSWRLIGAIYGCVAVFALCLFWMNRRPSYQTWSSQVYPGGISYGEAPEFHLGTMPQGVGFSYRGQGSRGRSRPLSKAIDWPKAEKSILDAVNKINVNRSATFDPHVTPDQINRALSDGAGTILGAGQPGVNQFPDSGELIEWNQFTLDVAGHTSRTYLPTAKVDNVELEKAVRKEIKERIAGMFKTMQARLSPVDEAVTTPTPPPTGDPASEFPD